MEAKIDWSEHQRAQGNNPGGQREHFQKPACESKAMMSIKTLGTDKTGFRLWNQKFINAITQVHTGARNLFEALQVKLDTARGAITDEEIMEIYRPSYPMKTCIVMHEESLPTDAAEFTDVVYRNRLVRLCCARCEKKFNLPKGYCKTLIMRIEKF